MDFELTTEQAMFKDMAKEFGIREIQPYVKDWDRDCNMPLQVFQETWRSGASGRLRPPRNMAVWIWTG